MPFDTLTKPLCTLASATMTCLCVRPKLLGFAAVVGEAFFKARTRRDAIRWPAHCRRQRGAQEALSMRPCANRADAATMDMGVVDGSHGG
jgi:hypothetical protein